MIIVIGCQDINSFEECVAAGNPVMESYPPQCRANGRTFVKQTRFTECTTRPNACTKIYQPVCGITDNDVRCVTQPCASTDAVDYGNKCVACSSGAYGYYEGTCSDNLFVVCQETTTGFDPVEFARENNGICVDICPGNYDPYTTQTGIQLCIKHYGIDEIEEWEICERSSENCDCVKTYETTRGQMIDDPNYRCVPARYAQRLIFRAGIDRLDENGDRSVVIA